MIEKIISGLGSGSGPGALLFMAARFNMLSPGMSMLVNGLRRAPAPTRTQLGGDWGENLDTIAHSLGCVVCGVFDDLVEGASLEEIKSIPPKEIVEILEAPAMVEKILVESFDVCVTLYEQYGPLTQAFKDGRFRPEGLVTQSLIGPILKKRQESVAEQGPRFKQLLSKKKTTVSSSGQDDLSDGKITV